MYICDLHCDLPDKIYQGASFSDNSCHWALHKLNVKNTYLQVFAHFVDAGKHPNAFAHISVMLNCFLKDLSASPLRLIQTAADLQDCLQNGQNMAVLSLEGGEALDGKLENVQHFYNLGVRFLTLTWNLKNELGESCTSGDATLTKFGLEVLKEMNRLQMIPDVSHLCEKGFWSVMEHSTRPVVATHSNAKALCNHPRNLTDAQFCALRDRGGLVGINFYPPFLESNPKKADTNSILRHIEHFMSLGGENTICLGADFDGIPCAARGIDGIEGMDKIAEILARHNYSNTQIEKIMGKNVLHFLLENL